MAPVCQLENYVLTQLHLDFIPPEKAEAQVSQVKSAFDYTVARNQKEKHRYILKFQIKCHEADEKENAMGYVLKATIIGFFSFTETDSKERMDALIRLNGVSILYGILRGIVATTTGSFPEGKFLLPTMMPQDIVKWVEEKRSMTKKRNRSLKNRERITN